MRKSELEKKKIPEEMKKIYIPPEIVTYTSEEIIEQIGPAHACSGANPCPFGEGQVP